MGGGTGDSYKEERTGTGPMGPKCPFYGFHLFLDKKVLMDSKGNQCALSLILDNSGQCQSAYSPCKREMRGETVDWGICTHDRVSRREIFADGTFGDYTVFPRDNSKGFHLPTWIRAVMEYEKPSE